MTNCNPTPQENKTTLKYLRMITWSFVNEVKLSICTASPLTMFTFRYMALYPKTLKNIINILSYVQILYPILFKTKYVDIVGYMVQQLFQKLVFLEDR